MSNDHSVLLSVNELFAERAARRQREKEADAKLQRDVDERDKEFKQRLDAFQMTDALRYALADKIKHAFERKETELVIVTFPVGFCTDGGRAVANIDAPPINKPDKTSADAEPAWLETLPRGAHALFKFWKDDLKPGGFEFGARVVDFPDGMPGHIALFFAWPRNPMEVAS